MGFGSYDESDRRDPTVGDTDADADDVELHKNDHEGTMSFESGGSADDLLAGLADIKEAAEAEAEADEADE